MSTVPHSFQAGPLPQCHLVEDARVAVRVIRTDEESMIARSAAEPLARSRAATGPSS